MKINALFFLFLLLTLSLTNYAQNDDSNNTLRGAVTLSSSNGAAVPNAAVTIAQLKRATQTDERGKYEFKQIPAGKYDVIVHLERIGDTIKTIEIGGGEATLDFELTLSTIREQVTVTASGSEEIASQAYQSVTNVGAIELAQKNSISIGEALDRQPGVAKRSFGPGSGRPVIRGFDGDRVLVLQNGLRLGGIASQSGDEVEPIDVLALDRVEIVKGPATLLYGSNAVGGVVNGISTNDVFQTGLSGYLTAFGGTNNYQAGASGGLKFGFRNFLIFANGGGQKADDYQTPIGRILNSYARAGNFSGGAGYFADKGWLSFTYGDDARRHGIPAEPDKIDLEFYRERRRSYDIKGGLRGLGAFVESGDFAVRYNDYNAREFEFETDENKTEFEGLATNKNFNYRANFNQKRFDKYSGTIGFSGFTRDFKSTGAEAPAPRTKQNSVAVYALEKVDFKRVGFQFGGRIEQNGYKPEGNLPNRNFVGFSGSAGVRVPLWENGSLAANYQHSFRAPALEELYNNGAHPGIQLFDVGNPNLKAEQSDGVDLSVRHNSTRVRLAGSGFFYRNRNFVFPAFTGRTDERSSLPIVDYAQGDSRYFGAEASVEAKIFESLWFDGKVDFVRAELTALNKPLPRIPPVRGTLGLDYRYKSFSVRPELILAGKQNRTYDNETPTSGYTVFNVNGSYTFYRRQTAHVFSVGAFNLTDKLYRNHLSFIKQIAPEIGRGARLNYTMRF